jgi:DegV family protein with EDD domain
MQLTADNTAIVLDSTADFPEGPARFPNWRVVPLYVTFGDETYRDYVELGPDAFYERLRTAPALPTTSQPTPGDFLAAYEELASYERIYTLALSAKLSGTWQSARTAAETAGGDRIVVVDTEVASAAVSMLGLAIQRRLERGTSDEELAALVDVYRRDTRILFTVDTLEYLAKGGRIGRAAAFAGTLLNVKPILTIQGGEVLPVKRVRGNAKAYQEFKQAFESETPADDDRLRVGIAHAAAPERLEALTRLVGRSRPRATIDVATTLGAVVGTHAGPGTVGFFWFLDRLG